MLMRSQNQPKLKKLGRLQKRDQAVIEGLSIFKRCGGVNIFECLGEGV